MNVPATILIVPFPVIAGVLTGAVGPIRILQVTRKLMRKLDSINRRKIVPGIRSQLKRRNLVSCVTYFRNVYLAKSSSASSNHNQPPTPRIPLPLPLFESSGSQSFNNSSPKKLAKISSISRIESQPISNGIPLSQQDNSPDLQFELGNSQDLQLELGNSPDLQLQLGNSPLLEQVFKFCDVKKDVKFETAIPFWKQKSARKIAEGSYGEIYAFRNIDETKRIFKCVAIDGQHLMNSYPNIQLLEALPDMVSSKCLSDLNEGSTFAAPNFPKVYNIFLVRDRFPELLMSSWWDYRYIAERLKDVAEHSRPDKYPESQLYLTIESSFCGESLTVGFLQNAWLGVSIMSQIISALAVAEAAYKFEHRDLHLGNILVQNTPAVSLKYTIRNQHFSIETVGCHIFIIDFTLSRISHEQAVYFTNLDEMAPSAYRSNKNFWLNHINMYKLMADYSRGDWDKYMPGTNIIWLKYLNETILDYLQKNNPHFTKLVAPPNEGKQMEAFRLLKKWNNIIYESQSATDLLQSIILKDNPIVSVYT